MCEAWILSYHSGSAHSNHMHSLWRSSWCCYFRLNAVSYQRFTQKLQLRECDGWHLHKSCIPKSISRLSTCVCNVSTWGQCCHSDFFFLFFFECRNATCIYICVGIVHLCSHACVLFAPPCPCGHIMCWCLLGCRAAIEWVEYKTWAPTRVTI